MVTQKSSRGWLFAGLVAGLGFLPNPAQAQLLLNESFEGVTLRPVVTFDTELRERSAWQTVGPSGPVGWTELNLTTVNPQSPGSGVTEFAGWRFVNKDWWITTSGDQNRSQFLSGTGIVAVADPDEWDDFGDPAGDEGNLDPANGLLDSTLITPTISLAGIAANAAKVTFNSSWVPEDQQLGTLTAVYNRGTPQQSSVVLRTYSSVESSANFKPEALNETVLQDLQNPAGATNVQLEFRLQGNNDWWWAIDNVKVFTGTNPGGDGVLRLTVNRNTGEVRINNATGSTVNLRGYSVRSAAGVFNETEPDFLSLTNSSWIKATRTNDTANDVSEVHLTSAPLTNGSNINLGPGVWQGFYRELSDLTFDYLVAGNDNPIKGIIEFTGNGGNPFPLLDLNFDGLVSILDWNTFKAGYGTNLVGLTEAVRYAKSDLDNNSVHNLSDFLEFQRLYNQANGPGSFAAMLAASNAVPEPHTALLALLAGCGWLLRKRRGAVLVAALGIVAAISTPARAQLVLLQEGFENVTLGPFQEETVGAGPQVWTNVFPAGWTTDNSGVPGIGNPATDGVRDWSNWAIAKKSAWDDNEQDRELFTRASGNVMVADADEWEDADNPAKADIAKASTPDNFYDVFAKTPVINIPSFVPAGRIKFSFDSSWRPEGKDDLDLTNNHNGSVRKTIIDWDSDPESPTFKPDAQNERVSQIDLQFDGAANSTVQLEISLTQAWNDWWWALDNLLIEVPTNPAKLRINTANGRAQLVGNDVISSSITAIDIKSPSGKFNPNVAGGLATSLTSTADGPDAGTTAGDSPGERWERLSSTTTQYADAFLFGSSSFTSANTASIGALMNTATLSTNPATATSQSDLVFTYSLASGNIVTGIVEYYFQQTPLPGDFNANGVVDTADYTVWRDNLGAGTETALNGNGNGTGGVDAADYTLWKNNFGASLPASAAAVPEPTTLWLAAVGLVAALVRRKGLALLSVIALSASVAQAADPPAPFVDRLYRFGDSDTGNTIGAQVTQQDANGTRFTRDSAGSPGMNQLIHLAVVSTSANYPTYVSTTDRPDGLGGIGIRLNASNFDRHRLRTGFGEALNFPEQSPSSSASLVNPGGTLNYFRINDRGFELWVKPTNVGTEQHIVMDSQQHGVLIDSTGKFNMRYASKYEVTTTQLPGPDNVLGTADDILQTSDPVVTPANYATDVTAVNNTWYHLSVVRPNGPGNGSIFYINGVAKAVTFGQYAVETIVNIGEGNVFTNLDSLDISPLTVGWKTDALELDPAAPNNSLMFRGIVDDLKMFVMGLNDNDNLPGGGSNVLNDYGEYIFARDNGYASKFKPAVDGDITGGAGGIPDGVVNLADATAFAANWLFEKRLTGVDSVTNISSSRLIGDLTTRAKGDFNYDGIVNLKDWAILNNKNPSAGALAMQIITGVVVPEPTSVGLLAVASLGGLVALRRR